uniref:Putative secreted protein n=1 Tax=Ixodes ricinus TaxID=34613 RepID=A0A6B0UMU0_IXORI
MPRCAVIFVASSGAEPSPLHPNFLSAPTPDLREGTVQQQPFEGHGTRGLRPSVEGAPSVSAATTDKGRSGGRSSGREAGRAVPWGLFVRRSSRGPGRASNRRTGSGSTRSPPCSPCTAC